MALICFYPMLEAEQVLSEHGDSLSSDQVYEYAFRATGSEKVAQSMMLKRLKEEVRLQTKTGAKSNDESV